MGIDKELLDILVCPKCKGDLEMGANEEAHNLQTILYESLEPFNLCNVLQDYSKKVGNTLHHHQLHRFPLRHLQTSQTHQPNSVFRRTKLQ